jgi:hypothetical protein
MGENSEVARSGRCRPVKRVGLAVAAVVAAWMALVVHPQPLFAYSVRQANVVLHARAPLPLEAGPLLTDVVNRLSRSPLYDPARVHHVFLCDTPGLFGLLALWQYKVGGVSQTTLNGNVLIRPFSIERNAVIGRNGQDKHGERTLAYFIAHEVTHAMTADRIGRWRYRKLAAFQTEGYADDVAFGRPLDLVRERTALIADAPEMSPRRSGLYKRYELLVKYLLERRGFTVDRLLARPLKQADVEAQLLADTRL